MRDVHERGIETVYQQKSLGDEQPLWRNFFVGLSINTGADMVTPENSGDPTPLIEAGIR